MAASIENRITSLLIHKAVFVQSCASESSHYATRHAASKRDDHNALHNEKFLDFVSVIGVGPIISLSIHIVRGIVQGALVAIGVESSNSRQDDRSYSCCTDTAQAA